MSQTSTAIDSLILFEVAGKMHSAWQETSGYKSREKKTTDNRWIAKKIGINPDTCDSWEEKVKEVIHKEERPINEANVSKYDVVDIQNTAFNDLPSDWQKENLESAENVIRSVLSFGKEFDFTKDIDPESDKDADIEALANMVHEAWMSRNKKEEWNMDQHKPYADLTDLDKFKDRNPICVASKALAEKQIPNTSALKAVLYWLQILRALF
ncbi:hypothetical protein [Parasitella parasitica]|uniref:Uncharacterized protein n=1 Tax=Parasitella parasitica TaxID=35722 RepID=A0A0B7NIY1_9FUNG|nr:hypothetical protein [Parasitella parasitica]